MNGVARAHTATIAATLRRLEDLATQLEACRTLQPHGRTAFHDQVTAVARAVAQRKGALHPMAPPPPAAGVALTEALRDLGHETTPLCEAIEQGLQARTASARGTGQSRPWDFWGGVVLVSGVVALLERLLAPWGLALGESLVHEPCAGLPAVARLWEPTTTPETVADVSATPEGSGDATQRSEASHGQRSGGRSTGED
jgi:hypothetical protein